jgi:transcriptional regulator with XRE-family HTH domain
MVADGNRDDVNESAGRPPADADNIDFRPVMEQLIRRRRELGMKQSEVAELMHTGQPTVSTLEKSRNPKLSTLMRYARAVGATVSVEVVLPEHPSGGDDGDER